MLLMKRDKEFVGMKATGRECTVCDEGEYMRDGYELICSQCQHTPAHDDLRPTEGPGTWDLFNQSRADYSGFYGDERVKMVGGFARVYDFETDFQSQQYG